MSTAAFSLENQITEKMAKLDNMTAGFLAGIAGISQTKLSQGLSGVRPLSNQDSVGLLRTLEKLERLQQKASPLPLAFKNPIVVRKLLADLEDGRLCIDVTQYVTTTARPDLFIVGFRNGKYFYERKKNGEIVQTLNAIAAAQLVESVADQLVERLRQAGHEGCEKIRSKFSSEDQYYADFESVWGTE